MFIKKIYFAVGRGIFNHALHGLARMDVEGFISCCIRGFNSEPNKRLRLTSPLASRGVGPSFWGNVDFDGRVEHKEHKDRFGRYGRFGKCRGKSSTFRKMWRRIDLILLGLVRVLVFWLLHTL